MPHVETKYTCILPATDNDFLYITGHIRPLLSIRKYKILQGENGKFPSMMFSSVYT